MEVPKPYPPSLPLWKQKQNKAKNTSTVRHKDFDLRHTLQNKDPSSIINSKRKSVHQRLNANPSKKLVPLMSLVLNEMPLAAPHPKISPNVTCHNKPKEVPHNKPKASSTVTSDTFVSPKQNTAPPLPKS